MKEILEEVVFIDHFEVLRHTALVIVKEAVELGQERMTIAAVPINNVLLVVTFGVKLVQQVFFKENCGSAEQSVDVGLRLPFAVKEVQRGQRYIVAILFVGHGHAGVGVERLVQVGVWLFGVGLGRRLVVRIIRV